ncbi:hypothetical protein MKW92_034536 [Papaver armeniacum]|nr:hypothetical protein MKW92_034536 [Papaver armeniacum]
MAQGNSYEEARKQRLEENKRRFQELGVLKIANSLSDVTKDKKKTPRIKDSSTEPDLMRRSSRPRIKLLTPEGTGRKNAKQGIISRIYLIFFSYISTRVATEAERSDALKRAMRFHLLSRNPIFFRILLEDEEGSVYETNTHYGTRLNQWKTFTMNHKLDDGDALVMELIEPTRFKVRSPLPTTLFFMLFLHIFRVSNDISEVQVDELEQLLLKKNRNDALKRAMSFQSGLLSRNPSFVKSMSRSQKSKLRIVLEDEEGSLYIVHYNGRNHKLDDGDALVIELIEPTRFKVYIFKVSNDVSEVKVDEPKKARESKSSKTVDAEQICQSCNSKKAEHCDAEIN